MRVMNFLSKGIKMIKSNYNAVSSRDEFNWDVLKDIKKFVIWRDFSGKILTPKQFKKFQDAVNQHRSICAADFVPQPFIKDLTRKR